MVSLKTLNNHDHSKSNVMYYYIQNQKIYIVYQRKGLEIALSNIALSLSTLFIRNRRH